MLAVLASTLLGVNLGTVTVSLLESDDDKPESVGDCLTLSADDARGFTRLLFITTHFTGSLSEDLARRRANFSIVTSSLKSFYEDELEFTTVSNYSGSLYWLISVSVISSCWYSLAVINLEILIQTKTFPNFLESS